MSDPAIRSRNIGNKRKGANFEIALVNWFRSVGLLSAERISKKGTRDEGDVNVQLDMNNHLIVEAKNAQRLSLSDWLRQASEQAIRWTEDRPGRKGWPVVIVKRRQHGIDKSYVVMELVTFIEFTKRIP